MCMFFQRYENKGITSINPSKNCSNNSDCTPHEMYNTDYQTPISW